MTRGLNWKEQLHWELYKQYLKTPIVSYTNKANMNETQYKYRQFNDCYDQSKLATDQFITNLAADAREQLEHQGWEESDFRSMIKDNTEQWTNKSNWSCYDAVERAISSTPLTNLDHD